MGGARRRTGQHVRCRPSLGVIPDEGAPGLSVRARPHPGPGATLRSHAGAARYAWNWGLDQCRKRYEAERKWYSGIDLHRLWNEEKRRNPRLAWWRENSKCAGGLPQPGPGSARLRRRQERQAERAPSRVPQAQAEGAVPGFLPLQHRGDALLGDHGHPPQVGSPIRTHESTEALARKMAEGKARILSATVSRTAQRWFVSFGVEVEREVPERHRRPGTAVGIDVGITHLITAVDHRGQVTQIPGPRPLRTALRRLRRACRGHARKQKGSANRRKSAQRLSRLHARISNLRAPHEASFVGTPSASMPFTRPRRCWPLDTRRRW